MLSLIRTLLDGASARAEDGLKDRFAIDLLAQRISDPGALLEVVTRQYYEIRALEDVKSFEKAGGQFVTGSYELAGHQLHLVSTVTDRERLSATLSAVDADVPNGATPAEQAEVVAVAREAGHHAKGDGAVAAEHQRPLAAVQGRMDAVGDPAGHLHDAVQVALPRVGRVRPVAGGRQVAVVLHLEPGRAQALDQAGPAERLGCLLLPRPVGAGAGRDADDREGHAS